MRGEEHRSRLDGAIRPDEETRGRWTCACRPSRASGPQTLCFMSNMFNISTAFHMTTHDPFYFFAQRPGTSSAFRNYGFIFDYNQASSQPSPRPVNLAPEQLISASLLRQL